MLAQEMSGDRDAQDRKDEEKEGDEEERGPGQGRGKEVPIKLSERKRGLRKGRPEEEAEHVALREGLDRPAWIAGLLIWKPRG